MTVTVGELKTKQRVNAMSPAEKFSRSAVMFTWTRQQMARQVRKADPSLTEEQLTWQVALKLYELRVLIHYPQGTLAAVNELAGLMLSLHNRGGEACVGTANPQTLAKRRRPRPSARRPHCGRHDWDNRSTIRTAMSLRW